MSYSEALGSARGLHSLGPSESESDAGDMHLTSMDEPPREPPLSGHKAYPRQHRGPFGGDTLHEEVPSGWGSLHLLGV